MYHQSEENPEGVRLIAINDKVDNFCKDDDFTPFRNIMNEWYARDAPSKKNIRTYLLSSRALKKNFTFRKVSSIVHL